MAPLNFEVPWCSLNCCGLNHCRSRQCPFPSRSHCWHVQVQTHFRCLTVTPGSSLCLLSLFFRLTVSEGSAGISVCGAGKRLATGAMLATQAACKRGIDVTSHDKPPIAKTETEGVRKWHRVKGCTRSFGALNVEAVSHVDLMNLFACQNVMYCQKYANAAHIIYSSHTGKKVLCAENFGRLVMRRFS